MEYKKNGMVYLNQASLVGQTFHWHDELELLIVIEGSVDLKVGYEWFHLKVGDIMLINSDEIHSMRETDDKNKIIFVYLDCNACYEMYPDFYEIIAFWTYASAFEKLNQNKHVIINNLSRLVSAMNDSSAGRVEECFETLIKSLIYGYRLDIANQDASSFQINDEKLDIIYRIIKYLYSNYDHKVNLQEISEQEYLSLFYLSHSFKDITGYSFRDWLNFIRVEKAEKLLLKTALPLTEISYQCGFSDVRYLNKHFSKWYKISPNKYRNLFKGSYEMYTNASIVEENASMSEILGNISTLTPRLYKVEAINCDIVLDLQTLQPLDVLQFNWKEELICQASWLMEFRGLRHIEDVIREIGFDAVIIDEFFSIDMRHVNLTMPNELHNILLFLAERFTKVSIIINCRKDSLYEIDTAKEFLFGFFSLHSEKFKNQLQLKLFLSDEADEELSLIIDQFRSFLENSQISYVTHRPYRRAHSDLDIPRLREHLLSFIDVDVRIDWLYSKSGFKNHLYYFYKFVSMLGNEILLIADNYLITKKGNDYQLFFNINTAHTNYPSKINYKITMNHLNRNYKLIQYTWDVERDDISSIIKNSEVIRHLTDREFETADMLSIPTATFDFIPLGALKNMAYELEISIPATSLHIALFTAI